MSTCPGSSWRTFVVITATVAATAAAALAAEGTTTATEAAGWYTSDQAQQGHLLYNTYCAQCHRPDLSGALGPALVGQPFLDRWADKTLGDLVTFEHTRMPADNPGSVPTDKLDEITAYILSKNGFDAGSEPIAEGAGMDRPLTP